MKTPEKQERQNAVGEVAQRSSADFAGVLQGLTIHPDSFAQSNSPAFGVTLDGSIVHANLAATALAETVDLAGLLAIGWSDLWWEESQAAARDTFASARAGRIASFSGCLRTAKQTRRYCTAQLFPLADSSGAVNIILVVASDASSVLEAECAARETADRFRALAGTMEQLAWFAQPDGKKIWFNDRWTKYTGFSMSELLDQAWRRCHPEHQRSRIEGGLAAAFRKSEPWSDTHLLTAADGTTRWFHSSAVPIRNDHGDIIFWCGTSTDIHEDRLATQSLHQNARLIELSHEAIIVWDIETGIVSWNRGCTDLYGFTAEEAIGRRSHELLATKSVTGRLDLDSILLNLGKWSGELEHVTKDGRSVWVDSRLEIIDAGERMLVLETNRDITERKRQLETSRLLLAELDHRVKNTLQIVQAIAAQTARVSTSTREFNRNFNARLQSLARAHTMLVDTQWAGATLLQLLTSQLAIIDGTTDPSYQLHGEDVFLSSQAAIQLSLIVFELASNARQHGALSKPGGKVVISWDYDKTRPRQLYLFWREEDGPKVNPTRSRGFGLSLIERIGSQAHLKAQVDFAETGLECQIIVDIQTRSDGPIKYFDPQRNQRNTTTDAAPTDSHERVRVLIVEDEPLIGMELEDLLQSEGYLAMGPIATVEEALDVIRKNRIDIALLDGDLQGEPVDEVAKLLVEMSIPFAMVTGFTNAKLPDIVVESAVPVVPKPVASPQIIDVVEKLAKRARSSG